ncbi:FGFR1 oncogene partner isoform X3 [Hypomesus transpacificus]|uniref:FGFR1 oncogene partner isoform X3 n=1 Tax=Hypomesus transpacificus TaxID=137520 RepID=UPI001F0879ED|nr:FGFR1 oncogene partner isoform X3 [Hypomesus transpacificus]
MSATEDDTELRDLLIQNLENNGVLNKLKAEMRAAVFLAMDEQDKVENKTPLVNENLKKCLNTKDGRLVASLIIDFLQVFHLDFTLAVFQPEINSLSGLDSREQVTCELGIQETDINRNTPLLLELIKRGRLKDKSSIFSEGDQAKNIPKELSPRQIAEARKKFDMYDKDRTIRISKEDLKAVFGDLFPNFNKNMLERFVSDELHGIDKAPAKSVDFQEFLGLYKRLFNQCRSVVTQESSDVVHLPNRFNEEKMSTVPASKAGQLLTAVLNAQIPRLRGPKHSGHERMAVAKGLGGSHSDTSLTSGSLKVKGQAHVASRHDDEASGDNGMPVPADLELGLEVEEDGDEGDSFFDDPLPKPQKTYGWRAGGSPPASLSDAPPQKGFGGPLCGEAGHRDLSGSRNATSNSKEKGLKDLRTMNDKAGSLVLDDDVDYDDDFNRFINSHRSDISKSEVSIGEEIEEVSIEGPENSDKFDDSTQDVTVSQISQAADYIEEVA